MKKLVFTVKINGVEKELAVETPDTRTKHLAQVEYNKAFKLRVSEGCILRSALNNHMREQGIWNDEKQELEHTLWKQLAEGEDKLAKGGIKLNEAKTVAIEMMGLRRTLQILAMDKNALDLNTVEGQADNARFDYLVSACTVYNDSGERVFKDYNDYLNKSEEEYANKAANELAKILYGVDDEFESKLPEINFLRKFGFMNKNNRLIDKQGRLVDIEGRLVDEDGRFIDENGELINIDGDKVDKDGKPILESQPFLDDDGNPVT